MKGRRAKKREVKTEREGRESEGREKYEWVVEKRIIFSGLSKHNSKDGERSRAREEKPELDSVFFI